jgi:beta-N-acetylhexosaminidase
MVIFISNIVSYNNASNISSCLKHFPGYGNNVDTHTGSAYDKRSYETFTNSDYLPFISGIKAGVPSIMVSHNVMESVDSTYPASLSKKVITGELRDKLEFSGIVITDDLAMDAVKSYVTEGSAAVLAINAGNDMIITSDFETMYNEVLKAVNDGTIKIETVDDAVRRILAWKHAYKLM